MSRILHARRPNTAVSTISLPSDAPTTLLVDGNWLLKCSWHATSKNPGYNVAGRNVGAVYQFLHKLRAMIEKYHITKCVVMWDGEHGGKLRHNLYPYYKANRKNKQWYRGPSKTPAQAEEDARSQRSIESQKVRVQTYLEELFVHQTQQNLMEGDDMMAYYCQQFHEEERIIIFTNDRDMCQLLALNGVHVFLDNLKLLINRDNFDVQFPYHYANAAVVKVFLGDDSDNIKGVQGLGDKTLFEHFPEFKDGPVTVAQIVDRAAALNEGRRLAKLKPLKVLSNICQGVAMRLQFGEEAPHAFGEELYRLNEQLMDLSKPMLTREAREDVERTGDEVLSTDERGAKNLLPLLQQDTLLYFFRGDLHAFCRPFLPMIVREKERFRINQAA